MALFVVKFGVDVSQVTSPSGHVAEELFTALKPPANWQVAYATKPGEIRYVISVETDELIEAVPGLVVGALRAAAHGMGYGTPDWPEPVTFMHVQVDELSAAESEEALV